MSRLRLRLATTGNVFRLRNRAKPINLFAGELTTQDNLYLFTQDGRGLELNQDVIENFQSITTQDGVQLFTQDDKAIISNQGIVDEFPGLLTQEGLEFITQDGLHILTNVAD